MKRWIIHLCIGLATFFTGLTVQLFVMRAISSSASPKVQRVEPPTPVLKPVAVTNAEPAPRTLVLAYDPEEFDPRGVYFILGLKPKAVREFDYFQLTVEGGWQGNAIGDASLGTKYFGNNPDYHVTTGNGDYSITGLVTKEQLVFVGTSKSKEDFQFIFDGHFLRGGTVSNARSNEPVVQGTLIKLKGSVKVAESKVRLRVEYLGC